LYVITGSPGVGKHSVAKIVSTKLGLKMVDISTVAIMRGAIITRDRKSYVVDTRKLARLLKKEVRKDSLVVGHLAPYVLGRKAPSLVIVIRRSPYELRRVYARRGYSEQKARDNLAAEAIGLVAFAALKRFGRKKVAEVDSTAKKPGRVASEVISLISGRSKAPAGVDWLSLLARRRDLHRFFDDGSIGKR
jgi:adenylate kinase